MIDVFESTARTYPNKVFLTFVDASGHEAKYSYRQARLLASAMAQRLRGKGVRRGDYVSVDLPNCAEYVLLALAAAYGSFSLVCLNNRLTSTEKLARLLELEREGIRVACRVDAARLSRLMASSHSMLRGDNKRGTRTIMGAERDAINDAIHFAEREAHLFDASQGALVMFTSGTTGKAKAVALTWRQLIESARASNRVLNERTRGMWQACLPLYHIGGFQVIVRSVENWTPVRLYARFDAKRLLDDAVKHEVTHVSVVDKMLQDMLDADDRGSLSQYDCILLGGGPLNAATVNRALDAKARVFASYGMTETSGQIANMAVTSGFRGGLHLLPGYSARIVDPDEQGFGCLAVRGPGVFSGYLNARAAFTVDGFFLTGDTAALYDGAIYMRERTTDMFVSGGENVYPAEIASALMQVPGVADAHVFGVPDEKWGRRPVAVVEAKRQKDGSPVPISARMLRQKLEPVLSKVYMPDEFCIVEEIPRSGIGKIDRRAVEEQYESRIQIKKVALYHVRLPFKRPFATARGVLDVRDTLIVEVIDHLGRTGLGECASFTTDWYLPETLSQDARILRGLLVPLICESTFLHPREVSQVLSAYPMAATCPMACASLEMAIWDLFGKIEQKSLPQLINEEYARIASKRGVGVSAREFTGVQYVPAGAVVGMGSPVETVEAVRACVEAGYRRVKLKIAPGQGFAGARAVREAFPDLFITLDANQSFRMGDLEELRAYDALRPGWIEEPIELGSREADARSEDSAFLRLASLQRTLKTPVCLDESFIDAEGANRALGYPELKSVAVKIGKFGGIEPALKFIQAAQQRGCQIWMGGMYDTGISKRAHAAFQTLPGLYVPGDIGATSRYFDHDITLPKYEVEGGFVALNEHGFEAGLGCVLNENVLNDVLVRYIVLGK